MTTLIITEDGMWSDGRVTCGDEVQTDSYAKVFRYKDCVVGATGAVYDLEAAAEVYIDGGDMSEFTDISGSAFIYQGGILRRLNIKDKVKLSREQGVECYGSGAQFAKAAMDFGKTPYEAIEYAGTRDIFTGGEIFNVMFSEAE